MTAGLQSWGQDNTFIQLDSSYRCLRLTANGHVTTVGVWGNGFITNGIQGVYTAVAVTVKGQFPIVAIRCGTTTAAMIKRVDDTTWTYTFIAAGNIGTPIDYWVFNEQLPNPTNVGMQIFKPDGTIVYDSNDSPARILDFISSAGIGGGANYQEQLLKDYGRGNWAVCQTTFSTQTQYENLGQRRALLTSYGVITRGNQLFGCRSISAVYDPGAGWGTMGSSAFYQQGYLVVDLDRI